MTVTYPAHREADVALRDGATVHIRPVRPDDEARLLGLFRSLSDQSRVFRFFSYGVNLPAEAAREAQVDYVRSFGLLALAGPAEQVAGHAYYVAGEPDCAEVAFAVADAFQGRGLGTILLGQLAEAALANGISRFEAIVRADNHRMLDVFRESGFPIEVQSSPGELHVTFPTSPSEAAIERFEQREQIAAVNALNAFFHPRAVAVIGASRQRGTVGGEVFHNLLRYGFEGPVYPVNPAATVVQSVPAYPSVEAIPVPIDLAVITVPAAQVLDVADACGRKGVRALVVISAGFAEVGEAGRARQRELVAVCRRYGMRLIGPNCLGIVNTDPAFRLNAMFGPLPPVAGRVGFSSQSGALGLAAVDYAGALALGLSTFVSAGNKADISGNDLLNYWESDPQTDVILLYLESFGNPRKFARIARRVGQTKPIVVVKSGRSVAGARATSSHTGALLAASDVPVEALFRQAGVIRTDRLEELFDVAALLANQPLPGGRRVGIVTNAGGPGILCADACEARGLETPPLSEPTQGRLRALLPAEASVGNPVDLIAAATAEQYRQALGLVAADPNVDAVVVIFIPPLVTRAEDVARAILEAAAEPAEKKPLLAVFMSARGAPPALRTGAIRIPAYAFPESAAIALAHAVRYAEWRRRPPSAPPGLEGLRRDEAAALVAAALARGGGWLGPTEVQRLLACYGVALAEQGTGTTPAEAGALAAALGGAVALKAVAPGLLHKTEAGAVRLGLEGAAAVQQAAGEMADRLATAGSPPTGFLVQRMVPPGAEMIVGVVHDPQFGPVIACGAGGVMVELLRDVSVRLAPLTTADAAEMVRELKSYPLLTGFRGGAPRDVAALEDALLRVGALAEDLPQIAELDCNPLLVLDEGAVVVDARVRVAPAEPPRPLGARR
jgi:acetyl coenzyme A synthetase (ADP forming)-like protein